MVLLPLLHMASWARPMSGWAREHPRCLLLLVHDLLSLCKGLLFERSKLVQGIQI